MKLEGSATTRRVEPRPAKVQLDAVDVALLRALSEDARATGNALAARVGVAESTVSVRLRALRASGVVKGFVPVLDLEALGLPLQAVIAVRLGSHSREAVDAFRRRAPGLPGVLSLFHVGGAEDYLLHVAVTDASALRDFVVEHLATDPAVEHTHTNIVFEHVTGVGWQSLV